MRVDRTQVERAARDTAARPTTTRIAAELLRQRAEACREVLQQIEESEPDEDGDEPITEWLAERAEEYEFQATVMEARS
jgi:chorismate synthase